ncbi:3'-5' exonuclease, partial [Ferrovibrio sp.]|uniref:ATP-dependent helicase n=1 Tax=Ferrovibrio sp. TaxID=1917215 RepID=UPI0025BC42BA
RFLTIGLKYRVIGGLRFYERREIRDAIAYIRVLMQPDDDLAFERIVNLPKRGLGDTTMQVIHRLARQAGGSLVATLINLLDTDEIKPKPRATLKALLADFARWRGLLETLPHTEVAQIMLEESGYTGMWQTDKSPEAAGRLENLRELIGALGEFENFQGFLDHVALVMDTEATDGQPMVSIMTLHAAKGLEFDYVFLPGWEEDLFPSRRSLEGNGVSGLEEERRLAYVGLTRARIRALISFAANRRIFNQWASAMPSRFIDELPAAHIEQRAQPGLYGGGAKAPSFGGFGGRMSEPKTGYGGHSWQLGRDASRGGTIIQGKAKRIDDEAGPSRGPRHFEIGERVFHEKFGYGRIRAVDGDKLLVAFEKAGEKKVIDRFVQSA